MKETRDIEKLFSKRKHIMYTSVLLFFEAKSSNSGNKGQMDRIWRFSYSSIIICKTNLVLRVCFGTLKYRKALKIFRKKGPPLVPEIHFDLCLFHSS